MKTSTKSSKQNRNETAGLRMRALHLAVASCFAVGPVHAKNLGDYTFSVQNGMAVITSNTGATLTIANSPGAILKWANGLNIMGGEKLHFQQDSSASAVLNRVGGGNLTQILGTLSSNGKVFLINPAGIVMGAGSRIDTAGFVASTLNMTDDDFINGRMRFNADVAQAGSVLNAGEIVTPSGGFVYLLAPNVSNTGIITTPSGEAILAAGNSVELVDSTNPALRVVVRAQSQDVNLSQTMQQSGGNIFSVFNSGKVTANTAVVGANGKIQFRSAGSLQTTSTSVIEAKGDANLDGGYFRGFADGTGTYAGSIDVSGRNGGFAETSAAYLDIANISRVSAKALAAGGKGGEWLLDPYDFVITQTEADIISDALDNETNVTVDTTYATFAGANGFGSAYGDFNGSGGNGDITVNGNISTSSGAGPTLYLKAHGGITVNGSITGSTLSLNMLSDQDSAGSTGAVNLNGGINIGGGLFIAANTGTVSINNNITTSDLNITTLAGGISVSNANVTAGPGIIDLESTGGNITATNSNIGVGTGNANIDFTTNNGNITLNNSKVGTLAATSSTTLVDFVTNTGNISILNNSVVGAGSGGVAVNITSYGGSITVSDSKVGVVGASTGSNVNIASWYNGNINLINALIGGASGVVNNTVKTQSNTGGSIFLNNSRVGVVGSAGAYNSTTLQTYDGDISITNGSWVGVGSGFYGDVDIRGYGGNVSFVNSGAGVQTGTINSQSSVDILAGSYAGGSGDGSILFSRTAGTAHAIRAGYVTLKANNGNIGSDNSKVVTHANQLNIGSVTTAYGGGLVGTNNIYLANEGEVDLGFFEAIEDISFIMDGSLAPYGALGFTSETALLASLDDLVMEDAEINFYGGGDYGVIAPNITMDFASTIAAPEDSDPYGGHPAGNLFIGTQNLTLSNESELRAGNLGINYAPDLFEELAAGGLDDESLANFLNFASSGSVNIESGSSIYTDNLGVITGEFNISSAPSNYTSVSVSDTADIIVAGDMNISGADNGGHALLEVFNEAFLTLGGQLKLTTSTDGTGRAMINVASPNTLYMDFPILKADGFVVDGVANAFTSARNQYTGIFVDGDPGVLGVNTFVRYDLIGRNIANNAEIGRALSFQADELLKNSNPDDNTSGDLLSDKDASEKFFGKKDKDKDKDKDGKDDDDAKNQEPKEC